MERGGLSTLAWPGKTACLAGGTWMVSGQAGHDGRLQREQIQSYLPWASVNGLLIIWGSYAQECFMESPFFFTPISVFSIVAYFESMYDNYLIDKN